MGNYMTEPTEGWTHVPIARDSKKIIVHTQEYIDEALFVVTLEYDEQGKLESKKMIRADLVKG